MEPTLGTTSESPKDASPDRFTGIAASTNMDEEERSLVFEGVRYTIIPSDDLPGDKTRLVRSDMELEHVKICTNS